MAIKEVARTALSSRPTATALRYLTHDSPLGLDTRHRLYLRFGRKVRPRPDRWFVHTPSGGHEIRIAIQGLVRELYWVGEYERDALPMFVEYARTARCVLDVGAAEGVYSLFAASVSSTSTVIAVEPDSQQIPRITANLGLNAAWLQGRVQLVEAALADRSGTATFHEQLGNSSLNPGFRTDTVAREVRVERGDDVVAELAGGRPVDLVKVDTESTEPDVLAGLMETLRRDRPVVFCEVLRGRTEARLQPIVDDLGYSTWWLSGDGPVRRDRIEGQPRFVNWLFLPDDRAPLVPPVGA